MWTDDRMTAEADRAVEGGETIRIQADAVRPGLSVHSGDRAGRALTTRGSGVSLNGRDKGRRGYR